MRPVNKPPHHTPRGYRNLHADDVTKSLGEVLRWRWNAARQGVPKPPSTPIPQVTPDVDFVRGNSAGGRTGVPTPRHVNRPPFVQVS